MKYLFTTANKAFAICIVILLSCSGIQAQKNTDSPYSRYGIGLINTSGFNGNYGLGGVGIAWRPFQFKPLIYDSLARSNAKLNDRGTNYINPINPASFSNISLTTFEASLVSNNVEYTSGSQSRTGSNTQFGHMAVALPLAQKWGVGFGIRPYSSVGYDYGERGQVNGNDVVYSYEGSGGVNELFVGTAVEITKTIALGVKGQYYFGTITDDRRVVYDGNSTNFLNTLDQRNTRIRALSYEVGLQYYANYKKDYRVLAGFTVSTTDKLGGKRSQLIRNYTGAIDFENYKDTALFVVNQNADFAFAPQYGIGFAFEKKLEWIASIDLKSRAWGDEQIEEGIEFGNSQIINVGFEKYSKLSGFGSYFKRMGYRLGARYNSSVISIDNEDIQEFGISFGIAMPLRKSFSTLNLGVELGRRGKDESNLTQEDFFNIQFGVTINDKWFIKRKYD